MSWALLFGLACGETEDDPTTDSGAATMPTGEAETAPGTDSGNEAEDTADLDSTSDDPQTTSPGTTGPSEESGGDPGTETSAADTGESSGGEADACELQPEDPACNACVKMNCCNQIQACVANNECSCFQECAAGMGIEGLMICGEMCIQTGSTDPNMHPIIGPVLQCTIASCIGDCI